MKQADVVSNNTFQETLNAMMLNSCCITALVYLFPLCYLSANCYFGRKWYIMRMWIFIC